LELKVYYSKNYVETELYEDAGDGYGYKNKAFSVTQFGLKQLEDELILSRFIDRMTYESSPTWATNTDFEVHFYGVPFAVSAVLVDGQNVDFQLVGTVYSLKIDKGFHEISLLP
jgi:alpha-glucosidase